VTAAAALAAILFAPGGTQGVQPPPSAGPSSSPGNWRVAPDYAALFAPARHQEAYRFFTSPREIGGLLEALVQEPASVRTPGAWVPRPVLPFDAFGQSGAYDRSRLARLYGSRRAQVGRGPRQDGGRIVESWTLISPYPDVTLTRLEPGTLLIVLRLP
jgi:hypothetical protein